MNSFARSISLLYFPWMWTIFLSCCFSFDMPCGHVAYLIWVCIFSLFLLSCLLGMWHIFFGYASFISFCIAHILDGNFRERESHDRTWSFSWRYARLQLTKANKIALWLDGNDSYLLGWKYSMWVDVHVILIMRVWQVSNKGLRIWQNSKQSQTAYEGLSMNI